MLSSLKRKFDERRFRMLTIRYDSLRELIDGLDEELWPNEYQSAREDCARVAQQRANLGARLHMEA